MSLTTVSSRALDASGIVKKFARAVVTHFNAIITVLNTVTSHFEDDGSGNITMFFNTAETAYIKWNAADSQFEFYVSGSLAGILNSEGWSTEPNV